MESIFWLLFQVHLKSLRESIKMIHCSTQPVVIIIIISMVVFVYLLSAFYLWLTFPHTQAPCLFIYLEMAKRKMMIKRVHHPCLSCHLPNTSYELQLELGKSSHVKMARKNAHKCVLFPSLSKICLLLSERQKERER